MTDKSEKKSEKNTVKLLDLGIDDKENSPPTKQSVPEGSFNAEAGGGSPVKKNSKKSKKRLRNPDKWAKKVQKDARNSGKAYSYKSKTDGSIKYQDPRKIGPACKCTLKCYTKHGMDKIDEIFKNFWAIAIYDVQNQYIDKWIIQKPTQQQQALGAANQARNKFTSKF